jgi:hypothetical protein
MAAGSPFAGGDNTQSIGNAYESVASAFQYITKMLSASSQSGSPNDIIGQMSAPGAGATGAAGLGAIDAGGGPEIVA